MTDHEHLTESVALTIEDAKEHGLSLVAVNVKLLEATLEKLNEHTKLKRVRDAAKKLRDMLRKTKHFGDLTEVERELFDALADTKDGG